MSNTIMIEGINSKGFGFAPKLVMKDTRLSIESKAIYMYFSSYCGSGESAFPKLTTILHDLKISENRYYKHFNPLKELGYIEVKPRRTQRDDKKWVADSNIYILKQSIDMSLTVTVNDSERDSEIIGNTKPSHILQNEGLQNEGLQNEGYINSNSINSNSINNNSMIDDDGQATEIKRRLDLYKEWTGANRITPPVARFIKSTMVISNDLYDLLLEKAHNKKDAYQYFKTSVTNCINENELTIIDYKKDRQSSDKDFRNKPKGSYAPKNKKSYYDNSNMTVDNGLGESVNILDLDEDDILARNKAKWDN